MWLLAAAPVVSQVLAASPVMHDRMAMADAAMHCDEHAGHGDDTSPLQPHAPSMAKCGYCDLLGHTPAISSVAWLPAAPPPAPRHVLSFSSEPHVARMHPLAAAPRGPPVDANA